MSPAGGAIISTSSVVPSSDESNNTQATPSPIPVPSSPSGSNTNTQRPHPKPDYPIPKLRIECHDLNHKGAQIFFTNSVVTHDLSAAVSTVLSTLYNASKSNSHIPPTRSVTLILQSFDGVAYTTGNDLDNDHKEIHFSLDYIAEISETRQHDEIQGVLVHEMVHCWQWNALGTCPSGLIEGVADFVRLKAGLNPPHWVKERSSNWDEGYQHTAYFLDWIEDKWGKGSVQKINETMMSKRYVEDEFWKGLFGKEVEQLWTEYTDTLPESEESHPEEDLGKPDEGEAKDSVQHDKLEKIMNRE
ncbi:MAG: hypothetical protein Q9190_006751 [Brigantiaea leucoxantha]